MADHQAGPFFLSSSRVQQPVQVCAASAASKPASSIEASATAESLSVAASLPPPLLLAVVPLLLPVPPLLLAVVPLLLPVPPLLLPEATEASSPVVVVAVLLEHPVPPTAVPMPRTTTT